MKKLIGLLAFIPLPALALPIVDFTFLEANWNNPQGGSVQLIDPVAPATAQTAQIRWGTTSTGPGVLSANSGYDYVNRSTTFTENPLSLFSLGAFTHFNQPIAAGTAINSVDLSIFADFAVTATDGTMASYTNEEFKFRFTHDETPNAANPCAYDESDGLAVPGTGVNNNGCADRVSISILDDTFIDPLFGLTLGIEGFARNLSDANNGIFQDAFISGEGSNNSAILVGQFEVAQVPVPGTLALLGLGLMGLAVRRRV